MLFKTIKKICHYYPRTAWITSRPWEHFGNGYLVLTDNDVSGLHEVFNKKNLITALFLCFYLVCSWLLLYPLWILEYLPLADLPDHAGQIKIIKDFDLYKDEYTINWWTPYLMGYVVTLCLSYIFGLLTSIKILLSICLLAIPLAFSLQLKLLNANRFLVFAAFPAAYTFSFYWGFLNFIVATPIAFMALNFLIWSSKKTFNVKLILLSGLVSFIVFFSHALAWGTVAVLSFFIFLQNHTIKSSVKRCIGFFSILPLVFIWLSSTNKSESTIELGYYLEHYLNVVSGQVSYILEQFNIRTDNDQHVFRLKEMFSFAIGKGAALDFVVISIYLLIWPIFIGAAIKKRFVNWLPLLVVISLFMLVPYWFLNTAYIYQRFAAFLFPASFFLFASSKIEFELKWNKILACFLTASLVLLLLSDTRRNFSSFKENDESFDSVINSIEPNKMVLTLILDSNSKFKFTPPYLHFGSWYQATKNGQALNNFSFDVDAKHVPVKYAKEAWPLPPIWNTKTFDWKKHNGWRYDYFLVRSYTVPPQSLFKGSGDSVRLVARHGVWYAYQNTRH